MGRAEDDGDEDQAARAATHHVLGPPVPSPHRQPAIAPVQIRMQVGEELLGAARRQLLGTVDDVRVEYGPDPRPVRRDEPVVRRAQFRGDRPQARRRLRGERGGGVGELLAEHPPEAGPHVRRGRSLHRGQVVLDRRRSAERSGDEELRPTPPVVHEQRPDT
nr:hypothetical protein GCM10020093_042200 [Planobispora longispora]